MKFHCKNEKSLVRIQNTIIYNASAAIQHFIPPIAHKWDDFFIAHSLTNKNIPFFFLSLSQCLCYTAITLSFLSIQLGLWHIFQIHFSSFIRQHRNENSGHNRYTFLPIQYETRAAYQLKNWTIHYSFERQRRRQHGNKDKSKSTATLIKITYLCTYIYISHLHQHDVTRAPRRRRRRSACARVSRGRLLLPRDNRRFIYQILSLPDGSRSCTYSGGAVPYDTCSC